MVRWGGKRGVGASGGKKNATDPSSRWHMEGRVFISSLAEMRIIIAPSGPLSPRRTSASSDAQNERKIHRGKVPGSVAHRVSSPSRTRPILSLTSPRLANIAVAPLSVFLRRWASFRWMWVASASDALQIQVSGFHGCRSQTWVHPSHPCGSSGS